MIAVDIGTFELYSCKFNVNSCKCNGLAMGLYECLGARGSRILLTCSARHAASAPSLASCHMSNNNSFLNVKYYSDVIFPGESIGANDFGLFR